MIRLIVMLLVIAVPSAAAVWRPLAPGVKYRQFSEDGIQAFKIDLAKHRLELAQARDNGQDGGTVASLAGGTRAVLAVNGGFFTDQFAPLGLLISRGVRLNPLRRADWGILMVTAAGHARIVHTRQWKAGTSVNFAIQAGPRLVVNGKPLKLKKQQARRTAIGILPGGRQVIIAVVNREILTEALAKYMVETLGCSHALNLDGGTSTQLWSPLKAVKSVSGFRVANGVLVIPR